MQDHNLQQGKGTLEKPMFLLLYFVLSNVAAGEMFCSKSPVTQLIQAKCKSAKVQEGHHPIVLVY